ncbi:MAG: Hsp20/alpha crystallin family protein [Gammaproteobacteria bacterium]|nr:MAG: Hsp20/alpha crystallin family protein [Gammaproteobacteria bacterium]
MALTPYDPFALINQLQQEMNRLFDARLGSGAGEQSAAATSDWVPLVDIREEQDRFVIEADVPGVDPKDIEVTMENGVLTIRGQRPAPADDSQYKRRERPFGTFYRRFMLPDTADAEGVSATGRHGVLQVVIPKRRQAQPRRITVEG